MNHENAINIYDALTAAGKMSMPALRVMLVNHLAIGKLMVSDISKELEISAPAVSITLTKLEAQGLIKRSRDKDDRRKVYISLTPKGKSFIQKITE